MNDGFEDGKRKFVLSLSVRLCDEIGFANESHDENGSCTLRDPGARQLVSSRGTGWNGDVGSARRGGNDPTVVPAGSTRSSCI